MGALKIDCYLSESQIMKIVGDIENHIADFKDYGVNDYEGLFSGDVHVFVDFEALPHGCVGLRKDVTDKRSVEVLSADYDLLEEDTAVLKSYLKQTLAEYNRNMRAERPLGDGYSWEEEMRKERYYQNRYGL